MLMFNKRPKGFISLLNYVLDNSAEAQSGGAEKILKIEC